jgi:hypothetical protein
MLATAHVLAEQATDLLEVRSNTVMFSRPLAVDRLWIARENWTVTWRELLEYQAARTSSGTADTSRHWLMSGLQFEQL